MSRRSASPADENEVQIVEDGLPPAKSTAAETSTNGAGSSTNGGISILGSSTKRAAAETDKPESSNSQAQKQPQQRKRARMDGTDVARSRRLLGVLNKTLNQVKEQTNRDSDANKRRAAVEERLAAKKREETDAIEARTSKERAKRQLKSDVMRKEDERNAFVAIYESRKSTKEKLANFLCTKHEANDKAGPSSLLPAPYASLPHALPPPSGSSDRTKPLYYLPYKLLPWQADQIDAQVEDVRAELDKEEEEWTAELAKRDTELDELRAKLDEAGGGADLRRSRNRRNAEDDIDSSLPSRQPLPDRYDRHNSEDAENDATMRSPDGDEDVVAY